jgi:hypothetical protein
MRFFYKIRSIFRRWNYKRKYGMDIEEGVRWYGKHVVLTEKDE